MIVNWFLNLLDCNVIEREIKREKVQMKPTIETGLISVVTNNDNNASMFLGS